MEGWKDSTLKEEGSNFHSQEDSNNQNALAAGVAEGNSAMLTSAAADMGRGILLEEGVYCMRFDRISTLLQKLG